MSNQSGTKKRAYWEIPVPKENATHRLFCFPFSGGSPLYFRDWCDLVHDSVEVCVLSTPGKGRRVNEYPFESMDELIDSVLESAEIFREKKYVFFGHSMGAWVATEICWRLLEKGEVLPLHMIISASMPLSFGRLPPFVHQMTDDELIKELRILGGTPDALLNDRDFMKNFFPGIRADFKILETHTNRHACVLPIDISVWSGIEDPRVPASLSQYWKLISQGKVNERFFSGGHMFIDEAQSRSDCIDELENILNTGLVCQEEPLSDSCY